MFGDRARDQATTGFLFNLSQTVHLTSAVGKVDDETNVPSKVSHVWAYRQPA